MFNALTDVILAKTTVYVKVDSIVIYVSWIMIAVTSLILYVLAVSQWLPNLLIAKRRVSGKIADRGIGKYVFPEGRGVAYETGRTGRGYIKKYMLFCYKGKKYLRCSFDGAVRSAYVEVLVYDNQDRLIETTDIYLKVGDTHYSEAVTLPDDTAYTTLSLIKVNGIALKKSKEDRKWFSEHMLKRRTLFVLLTSLATFIEGSVIISVIRYFLDLFLENQYKITFEEYVGKSGDGFGLFITFAAAAFVSIIGILLHLKNN
ncbi:MAG: hypothetical protein E7642_00435 [Ruminococcaceae bacterium]|nr:hypothetical protein [Oscillospiraceae bacterium]